VPIRYHAVASLKPNRSNILTIALTELMVEERIKSYFEEEKVSMKTIFRIARYEVSKDSSPTEFPNMRMIKHLCKDGLKSFPPVFFSHVGVSASPHK
jgi:hypothetical protein